MAPGGLADILDAVSSTVRVVVDGNGPAADVPIEFGLAPGSTTRFVYDIGFKQGPRSGGESSKRKHQLLALFPNPWDLPTLRARTELTELTTLLANRVAVWTISHGLNQQAVAAILRDGCAVLHIAGHGNSAGIAIEDDRGASSTLGIGALVSAIAKAEALPDLIVLACRESAASAGRRSARGFGLPPPALGHPIRGVVRDHPSKPCRRPKRSRTHSVSRS